MTKEQEQVGGLDTRRGRRVTSIRHYHPFDFERTRDLLSSPTKSTSDKMNMQAEIAHLKKGEVNLGVRQ
jgi:hypothetical protein